MAPPLPLQVPDSVLIGRFAEIVGAGHAITDAQQMRPYLVEWRDRYEGRAAAVLRPGNVDEVSQILRLANETHTAIVPQGGNTGLVGGQVPFEHGGEVVLSLSRLNRILHVDADANTIAAQAGCTLAAIHQAAEEADRIFPLSLGSEGSCQIGGNLSTNAGGTAVLAYGNMRDLTLGLQVVLANGDVLDAMRALRKDNTGYDLKHLFIGAEGTLGIITAAVLKLFPRPRQSETAFLGFGAPADAVSFFNRAQDAFGHMLTSFELIPRIGMAFVLRHLAGARDPLAAPHPWYVLMEVCAGAEAGDVRSRVEALLMSAIDDGLVEDGILCASSAQAGELWRMRTGLSEVQKHEGGSIKHDISVPVSAIPSFLEEASRAVEQLMPGARPVPFGHVGDGNLHYNVSQPIGADRQAFLAHWEVLSAVVHSLVARFNGSISAEHGIGRMKRDLLPGVKGAVEMALMRSIKRTLDPNGILNPGKLL